MASLRSIFLFSVRLFFVTAVSSPIAAQRQTETEIVFVHAPDGGAPWPVEDIYIMDAESRNVKSLTNDGHSHNPAWSPDGKRLLSVHDSELHSGKPS
jgi:dipeptidyl aminopeptidase/acylaminoacyl peptidase